MSKNATSGKVFRSLFNYDWKTAAETIKNEFLIDFCFIWHPTWPQERESNVMKWFGGYLIQCGCPNIKVPPEALKPFKIQIWSLNFGGGAAHCANSWYNKSVSKHSIRIQVYL